MRMIKRELLLCLTISTIVFVGALAWGTPFTMFAIDGQAFTPRSNARVQAHNNSRDLGQMQIWDKCKNDQPNFRRDRDREWRFACSAENSGQADKLKGSVKRPVQ